MHQMGCAVVALDVVPTRCIDRRVELGGLELLIERAAENCALGILAHGIHRERPAVALNRTGVADLTSGLDVEGILSQHQLDPGALLPEGENVGVRLGGLVADEALLPALDRPPPIALAGP